MAFILVAAVYEPFHHDCQNGDLSNKREPFARAYSIYGMMHNMIRPNNYVVNRRQQLFHAINL
jgi:hypothetical protein